MVILFKPILFKFDPLRVAKEIGQTPVAVMMGREDTKNNEDSSQVNGS